MKKSTKHTVRNYIAVFQEERDGGYSVWVPDLPGCASQGETIEEGLTNIKEAIELYLESADDSSQYADDESGDQFVVPIRIYA